VIPYYGVGMDPYGVGMDPFDDESDLIVLFFVH
jgi:hypothetical protein